MVHILARMLHHAQERQQNPEGEAAQGFNRVHSGSSCEGGDKMIEKWDGETPSEKWKAKLIYELQDKKYDSEDDILSLEMDPFDDVIDIKVEGNKFLFTLYEELHMTTAMREENMKFIIRFFKEELPYLQFEKDAQSYSDGEYWFRLIFKLKED